MNIENPFNNPKTRKQEKYTLKSDTGAREGIKNPGKYLRANILKELEQDSYFNGKIDLTLKEELLKGYPNGEITTAFDPENPFERDNNHFGTENGSIDYDTFDTLENPQIDTYIGKEENEQKIDVLEALNDIKKNTKTDPELEAEYQEQIERIKQAELDRKRLEEIREYYARKKTKEIGEIRKKWGEINETVNSIIENIKNLTGNESDLELQTLVEDSLLTSINFPLLDRLEIYKLIQKNIRAEVKDKFNDKFSYYIMDERERNKIRKRENL